MYISRVFSKFISLVTIWVLGLLVLSGVHNSKLLTLTHGNRLNESLLASQHYNRILRYAKCQTPFARVVNINSELHPSAIKKYIPHCTILHYCGPHSGCCRQENEQCVPKTIEEVKLYFWTIELTPRGHKKGIEVITMQNHTECMCAPINAANKDTSTIFNDMSSTTLVVNTTIMPIAASTTVATTNANQSEAPKQQLDTLHVLHTTESSSNAS